VLLLIAVGALEPPPGSSAAGSGGSGEGDGVLATGGGDRGAVDAGTGVESTVCGDGAPVATEADRPAS